MTTTTFSVVNNSADTAIASATMNSLANGAYALGAAINNSPTSGSVIGYDDADLYIQLASAVTTAAGAPNIVVWILPTYDGSVYPPTSAGSPTYLSRTFMFAASTSTTLLALTGLRSLILPITFKVQILNNLGVAFPASGNNAYLVRKTNAAW